MDVYADVLVLLNFVLDYLILLTAARLGGAQVRRLRLAAGAAVGALGALGLFLWPAGPAAQTLARLALCPLITAAAFGRRDFGRSLLLFCLVSFLFGGGVWALSLVFAGRVRTVNGVAYADVSAPALVGFALVLYGVSVLFAARRFNLSGKGGRLRRVRCSRGRRSVSFSACADSGCTLRDPVSNDPVILAEEGLLRALLSPAAAEILRACGGDGVSVLSALPPEEQTRFRLVPCRTVTGSALLPAFRPDRLTVDGREIAGLVALCPYPLRDCGARALVGEV